MLPGWNRLPSSVPPTPKPQRDLAISGIGDGAVPHGEVGGRDVVAESQADPRSHVGEEVRVPHAEEFAAKFQLSFSPIEKSLVKETSWLLQPKPRKVVMHEPAPE